jgi:peptidyl-prolyl cis-trans isomerase D
MFELIRKNKRISQVILAIIILPFMFFGMDAYFGGAPGGGEVASVGGSKITAAEFDQALREQQDRLREAMGGQFDRELFESEAFRRSVLESLINQRVLALHALDSRIVVTQPEMQQVIASLPAFQEDGRFSLERYERLVRAQGMSPSMFEARLAQDLRVQQIATAVADSAFSGTVPARLFLLAQLEEREIREATLPVERFIDQVALDANAAQAFYDANPALFERAPRLRAEYVVFDEAALRRTLSFSEDQIRAYYEGNQDQFGQQEERRARHILIQVSAAAPDAEVAQARERASDILSALRSDPERFEELARTESQDPGSAARGGDLGFFGPGAMVESFEEAAFSLEVGEISDLVRSDFGFHIIEVTAITPATIRPLEEVRGEIVAQLGTQEATRQFAMLAEQFSNTVYEQPDSLQPVAEELGLDIRATDWITRDSGSVGRFRDQRLINALFAEEVRVGGENTPAIEVERGSLVSARVIEFEAAQRLPYDEVREGIEEQLRAEAAARMAREEGEAVLAGLARGEDTAELEWSTTRTLQRGAPTMPQAAMQAVFSASVAQLPTHVGAPMPDGSYALFRIDAINHPELADDDPRLQAMAQQYERLMGEKDFNAYIGALRDRYKVEIRAAALRGVER